MCAPSSRREDVITPIEQSNIDSGNFYLLIRSEPNQSCTEYEDEAHWSYDSEDWYFPTESDPGKWIEGDQIKLETLSGLIWRGDMGGRLYKVEFEGEKQNLGPLDYFDISNNDYQRAEIESRKHIDECISLGIEVKKARLITRLLQHINN